MQIENFEYFEDIVATAFRLRDILDDLCTQPIPTKEAAVQIGLRLRLLASAIDDAGLELVEGVFVLAN
ncbi:MAG: hypothetical protein E5W65_25905 [Mesorhizobium sp.]|uniref:hypothetical protein n=1 Tax=Mesorhizobium sp. TaxID=1871066 RepID=UPI0012246AC3|nr:hypothetical protein [Mesorhizobium sp.]TIT32214.1 MAG: hypothetical protein E5W65_25905 [Mesorhizobium sp.]